MLGILKETRRSFQTEPTTSATFSRSSGKPHLSIQKSTSAFFPAREAALTASWKVAVAAVNAFLAAVAAREFDSPNSLVNWNSGALTLRRGGTVCAPRVAVNRSL